MSAAQAKTGPDPARAKQQVRRQFEAWAATYDSSPLNRFLFRPCYLTVLEEIARWHDQRGRGLFSVLDIGCGTGTLAALLAAKPWPMRVVGLDYVPSMSARAARKAAANGAGDRARFVAGDAEHLPFPDASFDVITCSNSFHHYPHQQAVVGQMSRLLRPGGRLIIIDGFRDNVIGWFVFDVVITGIEKDVHHVPWSAMYEHFATAGLTNIRQRKFNLWFPALATIGDAP
ncbi:MAG: class I SAM-dependent methyltransferase [Planctomycetota bacterium]